MTKLAGKEASDLCTPMEDTGKGVVKGLEAGLVE